MNTPFQFKITLCYSDSKIPCFKLITNLESISTKSSKAIILLFCLQKEKKIYLNVALLTKFSERLFFLPGLHAKTLWAFCWITKSVKTLIGREGSKFALFTLLGNILLLVAFQRNSSVATLRAPNYFLFPIVSIFYLGLGVYSSVFFKLFLWNWFLVIHPPPVCLCNESFVCSFTINFRLLLQSRKIIQNYVSHHKKVIIRCVQITRYSLDFQIGYISFGNTN